LKKSNFLTLEHAPKVLGAALAASLVSMSATAGKPQGEDGYNGNGAPSGSHYTLNILGMEHKKNKSELETIQSNGRRIFVNLNTRGGTSDKILLVERDTFQVIDYDGTDGYATFGLPNPDPNCDGETDYSVFIRALGGGGDAKLTTCIDPDGSPQGGHNIDGDEFCSTTTTVTVYGPKGNGASTFTNVSKSLLYVTGQFDLDANLERVPIFGDDDYGYFWDYDNNGLRLAQLRFYEVSTDVDEVDVDITCEIDGGGSDTPIPN
jgi:hypothetical protein